MTSLPAPPSDLDPEQFASMGAAFMSAKLLCVGVEIGLFERLADGPLTLEELVSASGLPARSIRVVANGLAALQILELRDNRYANGRAAQAFLAGRTSVDVRAGLRLYNQIVYPMWMQFENTVRTGEPGRHGQSSEHFGRIFSEGVEAWTAPGARALAEKYDFSQHRRILDVGGGTGSYLVAILGKHRSLQATLFELPPSAAAARRRLSGEAVRDRIDVIEGDALFDPLPPGHDVVLLAGFIHLFNPDKILRVLRAVRERVEPKTKLIIVDQWMNANHTAPVFGAMLAATYLLLSGDGDTYSVDEAKPWLAEAGWHFAEHLPLAGVISAVVAEAQ